MYKEMGLVVRKYASRTELREIVVSQFLKEEPGLGTGSNTARYRYNVEKLSDGRRIYLTRPAYLKKGFDFRINVEGTVFQTGQEYPKHDDIFHDLRDKQRRDPLSCRELYKAIQRVYDCEDPEDILSEYESIKFDIGHSVELLLKVIKWFFIEQDIRDWNYSGRAMFMRGVTGILL